MEQCKKSSPRTRHIHSSFPHYFYSTPAGPPSSGSITAFVDLCESQRLAADADDFAFASSNRHVPTPATVSFADDLFRGGKLLPTEETATAPAQPLKPPPRLQYIANIRKSLRYLRRSSRGEGGRTKAAAADNNDMKRGADPFAAAADKVAKEDAPWCQLPWRRKSNAAPSPPPHEAKSDDEERSKSRKENWIFRLLRSALKGKESRSSSDSKDSKEEDGKNGQLVGLVRSTTVSRYRTTQYGSRLFYCFGFK